MQVFQADLFLSLSMQCEELISDLEEEIILTKDSFLYRPCDEISHADILGVQM